MTDLEIIEHLRRYSSDPDDQSLVYRIDRPAELKAQPVLSPVEERLVRTLQVVNALELDYLRHICRESGYWRKHSKPYRPKWHCC
jgi:predicted secreted protein